IGGKAATINREAAAVNRELVRERRAAAGNGKAGGIGREQVEVGIGSRESCRAKGRPACIDGKAAAVRRELVGEASTAGIDRETAGVRRGRVGDARPAGVDGEAAAVGGAPAGDA